MPLTYPALSPASTTSRPLPAAFLQRRLVVTSAVKGGKRKKASGRGSKKGNTCVIVTVEQDGSDLWRLDSIIDQLRQGAVSLIMPHA